MPGDCPGVDGRLPESHLIVLGSILVPRPHRLREVTRAMGTRMGSLTKLQGEMGAK